ncbi:hypothetical protein N7495_001284 [Penicillium taxi]|uniref:uncharacterized protein n=1 Tax=Penicillium taxi TaxID=168475 RepID=UPI002545B2C5|nr:uncharacterized protein N7495_001284 [Penicillium taxi]KAJ5908602.1 hypothetical protein N7495_001284 [Penicillium taxi]
MRSYHFTAFISLVFTATASVFPRETFVSKIEQASPPVTEVAAPTVTTAPRLHCSDGSTILHTTDCTMGTSVSFCHKPEPPIKCGKGFFPSVWHPDHCMEQSTCFPVDADWITTECLNGAMPYSTSTLFDGRLSGGESTVIGAVSCSCAPDQWYSMTIADGASNVEMFCMPYSSCPPGMTTSTSTNDYCASATATGGVCEKSSSETHYCQCEDPMETAIYSDEPGSPAIGCDRGYEGKKKVSMA